MSKAASFAVSSAMNHFRKKASISTGKVYTKPMQVAICPTMRCNAKCLMCDCWHEKSDYISKDDILTFIEDMHAWRGSGFFVQIAGGEPLIYKGIYEIFKKLTDLKISSKITTNGYSLSSEKVCDQIIESGLPYLSISIDSHIPEVHDEFRGREKMFSNAMKGIEYLRKNSDMMIGISSIIMKDNVGHLPEFTDFLVDLDVDRVLFQPMRDYYNPIEKWQDYRYWVNDYEALDRGLDHILKVKETSPKFFNTVDDFEMIRTYFRDQYSIINKRECYIGYEQLFVSEKGDITMCDAYNSIGNIKDRNIEEVWYAQETQNERNEMVGCTLPCTSNCKKELSLTDKVKKFVKLQKAGLFD